MSSSSHKDTARDCRPLVLLVAGLVVVAWHVFCPRESLVSRPAPGSISQSQTFLGHGGAQASGLGTPAGPTGDRLLPADASPPPRLAPFFFQPLPINDCDEELLLSISGVGPALAGRILEFRRQHGRIRGEEDLLRIKGIGPAKLKEIGPAIVFD